MKKVAFLFVLGAVLIFAGCDVDCPPVSRPELGRADATLSSAGGIGAALVASDLRLNLSLDVKYVSRRQATFSLFQRALACSPAPPSGFDDEIASVSLVCDRQIRGFAPGKNILTTNADVFRVIQGPSSGESITFGQWLEMMNEGETSSLGGQYGGLWQWRDAYDVTIAFIPEGTDAVAGSYKFTFAMEMQSGTRYEASFTPVTIAALP